MRNKHIAVVGAGLAGLSVAWHLVEKGAQVTLFDPLGIGGGASGASTGLMHPFPGKKAALSWRAKEGMAATRRLLDIAEEAAGHPVAARTGIFRPAITEEQRIDFRACNDIDAEWKEGLWIPTGITIYSRPYLQGLWKACKKRGAVFVQEPFRPGPFDRVVLAVGSDIAQFTPLPLRYAIGQSLVCKWEKPLPFSLASHGYIAVTEDPSLCQVGSTYEHTAAPDPKKALELLDKAAAFYPPAKEFEVVEIRSGMRVSPKDGHRPIVERLDSNTYVFTGLGSRGMLYHALLGGELADAIVLDMYTPKRDSRIDTSPQPLAIPW